MSHLPDPQNLTHLSVMLQGEFAQRRPNLRLIPTLSPGDEYVALTERIIEINPVDGSTAIFFGYLEYRICNVKRYSRMQYMPVFSSVEVRGYDHEAYIGGKVHFAVKKVKVDDPQLLQDASVDAHDAVAQDPSLNFDEELLYQVGKRCFRKVVDLIENLIENNLKVDPNQKP